jgi:N-methylhydantoinase B/oxoprolinase/acetone carboxylase alpha subunit
LGDFRALIAAVDLGERRMADVAKKYGMASFLENVHGLMDYSERRMRAEIELIPDGRYFFEDVMEDDGITDQPYTIKAEVTVKGSDLIVDYHGSSPQAKGPINGTLGVAHGAAYNTILQLTDSTIPNNSGCFRPIRVLAPPGTVVNVNFPAPRSAATPRRIAGSPM